MLGFTALLTCILIWRIYNKGPHKRAPLITRVQNRKLTNPTNPLNPSRKGPDDGIIANLKLSGQIIPFFDRLKMSAPSLFYVGQTVKHLHRFIADGPE